MNFTVADGGGGGGGGSGSVPSSPPSTPTLVSPINTTVTSSPTYTWNAVAGATDYCLAVADSTGYRILQWFTAADAGCTTGTGTCSLTPATLLSAGANRWGVQARNSLGSGPWSTIVDFTVYTEVGSGSVTIIANP